MLPLPEVPVLQRDRGRFGGAGFSLTDPLPEVTKTERLHEGFISLRRDTLRYASGNEGTIELIEHGGGVAIIALDEEDRILFVRQYRHPAGRWLLELPAGTVEPGEDPKLCAERELQEETGYRPGRIEELGGFYLAPGYSSEYMRIYLASELAESRLQGDEDEIHLQRLTLDEALAAIASGEIEDAKTLAGLLLQVQKLPK
jgi:ADP-ribose pyrophosphatase